MTLRALAMVAIAAFPGQGLVEKMVDSLSDLQAHDYQQVLHYDWSRWARPEQVATGTWDVLGLVAGRGAGKTRPGSQTTIAWSRNFGRVALVGRTIRDTRETMVLGESGILACCPPWYRPVYRPTRGLVEFPSGSQAFLFSADEPDQLRGPQFEKAWGDEFAAWKRVTDEKGNNAWSNLQDATRLGTEPQILLTTTPRATQLVLDTFLGPRDERGRRSVTPEQAKSREWSFELEAQDAFGRTVKHLTVVRRWSTEDNATNLAPGFTAKRRAKYAGSRLEGQELDAEFLLASDNALWVMETIDLHRVEDLQSARERLVVAVDPTKSQFSPRDECGIVVAVRCVDRHAYVLEDGTLKAAPFDWGTRAVSLARKYNADAIVWEATGIDQAIRDTLKSVPGADKFRWESRTAVKDKKARAEPVSAIYRAGRVHHVGNSLELLEDEMITWDPNESRKSPNRIDALVWAVTDLLLGPDVEAPVVRPGSLTRGN